MCAAVVQLQCSCRHSRSCVCLLCAAVGTAGLVQAYCVQLQAQQVLCRPTVCSCRHRKSCVGLLCAAIGTASLVQAYSLQLQAQQVLCRPSVCSCRHSRSYVGLLCAAVCPVNHQSGLEACTVWRPYCVQLQAQQVISMVYKHVLCMQTLLCAAVGTQKSSVWVRSM